MGLPGGKSIRMVRYWIQELYKYSKMQYTISHSERNKGWNSFWSYLPDLFLRLNNRFYTIKQGQLWIHNDVDNPVRNNFYNSQYASSVKTVVNDVMAEDKIFKTLVLESNQKWDALLATNLTDSSLDSSNFNTRESRQFSFIRGNEDSGSLNGNAVQGIGVITNIDGVEISFSYIPDLISVYDILYQLNGEAQEEIGLITDINRETNTVIIDSIVVAPQTGFFSYAKKDSRVEGEEIRGYYLEVELSNNNTEEGELFAVSTNVAKSYV